MARPALTTAILIYVVAVVVCTVRVLGYSDSDWLLILIVLTLPWSLLSVVFIWSLIHGASLVLFWAIYLGGGALNAFIFHRYLPGLYARLRRRAR